jgi:hypothetical protein
MCLDKMLSEFDVDFRLDESAVLAPSLRYLYLRGFGWRRK